MRFGKRGNYVVETTTNDAGNVMLRVLAKRGDEDARAKLIATVLLTPGEAHDLGWELRSAQLEARRAVQEAV